MDVAYTIGELAGLGGVPTSTVRYYERVGLLRPAGRTQGNYRLYEETALERIRFIRAAQTSGFTLNDITRLLEVQDGATAPCKEVELLIEARLIETRKRMADLRRTEAVLKSFVRTCRETSSKDRCRVLERLVGGAKAPPARR